MSGLEGIQENVQLSLYLARNDVHSSLSLENIKRPFWVVSHVQQGSVVMSCGGGKYCVNQGEVMIHPPDLPFSEHASTGVHQFMQLDVMLAYQIELFRYYPVDFVIALRDPASYARTFEQLLHVWNDTSSPTRQYRLFSYTLQLISDILDSWMHAGSPERPLVQPTAKDRFSKVIHYLQNHLHEKISRQDLASLVHLHPNYFDRAFHSAYGMSPMQMLKSMRLDRARKLLADHDGTLDLISEQCGFGDAAHLCHMFRKQFGVTPGEYRESVKLTTRSYTSSM